VQNGLSRNNHSLPDCSHQLSTWGRISVNKSDAACNLLAAQRQACLYICRASTDASYGCAEPASLRPGTSRSGSQERGCGFCVRPAIYRSFLDTPPGLAAPLQFSNQLRIARMQAVWSATTGEYGCT
jgi:hypothetical protein